MKKVLALILALCMAFALAVPAYAADDEEVSGPLVLYSSMTEFDLEALETCFNEVYPDVEIEVVSGSVGEYAEAVAISVGTDIRERHEACQRLFLAEHFHYLRSTGRSHLLS